MTAALHVAVRLAHVLAMALLLGGGALLWGRSRRASDRTAVVGTLALAVDYEWGFWAAIGVVVATGVGNLGALAPAVPSMDTAWGLVMAVKLLAVVVFLLWSLVRTSMVAALEDAAPNESGHVRRRLRLGYGATTLWLGGLVVLGVVLAHG